MTDNELYTLRRRLHDRLPRLTVEEVNDAIRIVAEAVADDMHAHGGFDDIDFADYKRELTRISNPHLS